MLLQVQNMCSDSVTCFLAITNESTTQVVSGQVMWWRWTGLHINIREVNRDRVRCGKGRIKWRSDRKGRDWIAAGKGAALLAMAH